MGPMSESVYDEQDGETKKAKKTKAPTKDNKQNSETRTNDVDGNNDDDNNKTTTTTP